MPAPQSGQTRLRIAEIKVMLAFLTTAKQAIMSLPFCGSSSPPNAQNLKRRVAGAFWEGAHLIGLRPLASYSNLRATASPNASRQRTLGNIELPSSQSSHLELQSDQSIPRQAKSNKPRSELAQAAVNFEI